MSKEIPKVLKCPSIQKCPFKRFDLIKGMECTLSELPEHISAICSRRWDILVLKKLEVAEK